MAECLSIGAYFGDAVKRRQALAFVVTENRFFPNQRIPQHRHAVAHFTCILQGSFVEMYEDASYKCDAGSVLVVPEARLHEDVIGAEGAHTLSFEVSPKLLAQLSRSVEVLAQPGVASGAGVERLVRRTYQEFRTSDPSSLIAVAALGLEILAVISRTQSQRDDEPAVWMQSVMARLHRDPTRNTPLRELARIAGVHPSHLSKTFRRLNGCTVGEYVRWLRLEEAKRRLSQTDDPVSQIAIDAGFYDLAHFSRVFRKTQGLPPSKYRLEAREENSHTYDSDRTSRAAD